jgi:hypothetical protein
MNFINIADNQAVYKSIGHFGQAEMNDILTKKPTLIRRAGFCNKLESVSLFVALLQSCAQNVTKARTGVRRTILFHSLLLFGQLQCLD